MSTTKEKEHINDIKIAVLENNSNHLHETLMRLEAKMDAGFIQLESKMDAGFRDIKSELVRIENKVDSHFKWLLTTLILSLVTLALSSSLTFIAKMYHWIT